MNNLEDSLAEEKNRELEENRILIAKFRKGNEFYEKAEAALKRRDYAEAGFNGLMAVNIYSSDSYMSHLADKVKKDIFSKVWEHMKSEIGESMGWTLTELKEENYYSLVKEYSPTFKRIMEMSRLKRDPDFTTINLN
jgi:hypothetical protein